MFKLDYPQLGEVVFSETLSNGLQVILIPKKDFFKTYGIMTTNFGSIDNHFVPIQSDESILIPDGIAHFLEHKLFEGEEVDAFDEFSQLGASANAFTSFTRTSYLFSTTSKVKENVETLLNFVQKPHFTIEGTEKEKGIIAQEINMYKDRPEWQLFYGLLKNMYPQHPISIDIAGTVDSIQEITPELLQTCYDTFYHPANMNLLLIGNFEPDEMIEVIRENQNKKLFPKAEHILRLLPHEDIAAFTEYSEIEMDVKRPKLAMGVKGLAPVTEGKELDLYYLKGSLLLDLLFGRGSENYIDLYDEGLVDDSFNYSFNIDRTFHFLSFESDTDHPEVLQQEWKRILLNWDTDAGMNKENFELLKRALIGEQLQAFNSLEYVANQYGSLRFNGIEMFDRIKHIESLTLEDIKKFADQYLKEQLISAFVIRPKKKKKS